MADQEYVLAPWEGDHETDVVTVELPAREVVAQIEVPLEILTSAAELGVRHGIPTEQALAERLELNRARVELLAARSVEDLDSVRSHLEEAATLLGGVETLDTSDAEAEVERIWTQQLDSP